MIRFLCQANAISEMQLGTFRTLLYGQNMFLADKPTTNNMIHHHPGNHNKETPPFPQYTANVCNTDVDLVAMVTTIP